MHNILIYNSLGIMQIYLEQIALFVFLNNAFGQSVHPGTFGKCIVQKILNKAICSRSADFLTYYS